MAVQPGVTFPAGNGGGMMEPAGIEALKTLNRA